MITKKNYLITLLLLCLVCFPVFAKPQVRYVAVEEVKAKEKPSFWSRRGVKLYYGDVVEVMEEKGSWVKVKSTDASKTGWVKESCVTTRKIVAKNKISLDADELALAGKGFSNALEAEFSDQYDVDFKEVDAMEKVNITEDQVMNFITEGKLNGGE